MTIDRTELRRLADLLPRWGAYRAQSTLANAVPELLAELERLEAERDQWKREAESNGKHELRFVEEREAIKAAVGFEETADDEGPITLSRWCAKLKADRDRLRKLIEDSLRLMSCDSDGSIDWPNIESVFLSYAREFEPASAFKAERDALLSVVRNIASQALLPGLPDGPTTPEEYKKQIDGLVQYSRNGFDNLCFVIGEREEALRQQVCEMRAERDRLRTRLLSAAGDDLCRLTQEEIKAMSAGKVQIPPKEEFLASCERFHAQIAGEAGVMGNCLTLAQLIAENEVLRQQLAASGAKVARLVEAAGPVHKLVDSHADASDWHLVASYYVYGVNGPGEWLGVTLGDCRRLAAAVKEAAGNQQRQPGEGQ